MENQSNELINQLLNQIADYAYKLAVVSADLVRKREELKEKTETLLKKDRELQKLKEGENHAH